MGSTPSVFNSEFLYWVLLNLLFKSPLILIFDGRRLRLKSFINLKILLSKNLILLKGCILICFGEKLYVIFPLCSIDSIDWVVTFELDLSLYEKPVEKFSMSQKSTLEFGFILSFLILLRLIDFDSILSSVNLL